MVLGLQGPVGTMNEHMSGSDQEWGRKVGPGVTPGTTQRTAHDSTAHTPAGQREWEFTQLWTAAQPTVHNYVRAILGDRAAVDDVLQEVALAVYSALDTYDSSRPFVAWALGIARNKARDRQRSVMRQRHVIHDMATLEALAEVAEELDDELDRERDALADCLDAVEGRASELLRRHYFLQQEPKDIAEDMGLQAGHVRVLLNRIRATLRACIERRIVKAPQL